MSFVCLPKLFRTLTTRSNASFLLRVWLLAQHSMVSDIQSVKTWSHIAITHTKITLSSFQPCAVPEIERSPKKLHYSTSSEVFFVSTLSHVQIGQKAAVEFWVGTPRHYDVTGGCRRLAKTRVHRGSLLIVCSLTPRLCPTALPRLDWSVVSLRYGFVTVPIASLKPETPSLQRIG